MDTSNELLIFGVCLALLFWATFIFLRLSRKRRAELEAREGAGVATTTATGTTTASPAPAAAAAKPNWGMRIAIGVMASVIVWLVVIPAVKKTVPPTRPSAATAPKKELQKRELKFPLEFIGDENTIRGQGWIRIRKEVGCAAFRIPSLPIIKEAKYEVIFFATRKTRGRDLLKINSGKDPIYYEFHPPSDGPVEIAFLRQGMTCNSTRYFYPTENFFYLSADDDLLVQLNQTPYVKITYRE